MLDVRVIRNRINGANKAIKTDSGYIYVSDSVYRDLLEKGEIVDGKLVVKKKTKAK